MIEYSKQISERWGFPHDLANLLCVAYERGDSPCYLAEYNQHLASGADIAAIREAYTYLAGMEEIAAKRKRVANAYKKPIN